MPLNPSSFVDVPPLHYGDHVALVESAHKSLTELIMNACLVGGPIKWTLSASLSNGAKLYSGRESVTDDSIYCGVNQIRGSLDDISARFHVDHQADYLDHARILVKDVVDASSLLTVQEPSQENPYHYVGIQWMSLKSPTFFKNRDVCLLECHDEFEINGVRGWACVYTSIRLPWFPSLEKSHGLVRATVARTGYVFMEMPNQPDMVQVTHVVHADLNGNMPYLFCRAFMKRQAGSVAFLYATLHNDTYDMNHDSHHYVPTPRAADKTNSCTSCLKKFTIFSSKDQCQTCGGTVCKKCIMTNTQCRLCCFGLHSMGGGGSNSYSHSMGRSSHEYMRQSSYSGGALTPRTPLNHVQSHHQFQHHLTKKKKLKEDRRQPSFVQLDLHNLDPPKKFNKNAQYEIPLNKPSHTRSYRRQTQIDVTTSMTTPDSPPPVVHLQPPLTESHPPLPFRRESSSDDTNADEFPAEEDFTEMPTNMEERLSLSCVYSFRVGSDVLVSNRSAAPQWETTSLRNAVLKWS
ncbi:hypothetical protein LEN26_018436 [Aphanomyces euteiches]|nr:hypothetical protein LEN26_018436 [Aphanomyces euteiches]KAH9115608.1 hypothetical protein AeMF1_010357 [Aphanomyces euteiches]KAH9192720.1 hypothetical protein AeNC1_005298 [Aphanomyces euteiches]